MLHSKQFFLKKNSKNTSELPEPVSVCQCLGGTGRGALGEPGRHWQTLAGSASSGVFFDVFFREFSQAEPGLAEASSEADAL